MRALLTFRCEGDLLAASLDRADGTTGLLIVTGGTQIRAGPHRMNARLASALAGAGLPAFRFDRRGVGDSEGGDPGFRESGPDIAAAAAAFRAACPGLRRMIGFGLCDGAAALALHGDAAGLDALVLANPWMVETEPGTLAPAAARHHYGARLSSREGWGNLLSGRISYGKLLKGIAGALRPASGGLADAVAGAMERHRLPVDLILAEEDGTAVAAERAFAKPRLARQVRHIHRIASDSHGFARPGDAEALLAAVLDSVRR